METVQFPRLKITLPVFISVLNKTRRAYPNTWLQGQVWVDGKHVQFKVYKTWLHEYRVGSTRWDTTSNQTAKQFQINLRAPFKKKEKKDGKLTATQMD